MVWRNNWLRWVLLFLVFTGVFTFLRHRFSDAVEEESGIPVFETKEFQDFYDRFGKDSLFQIQHITFPLEGKAALRDSMPPPPPDFRWQRDTWVMHRPYNDMDGTFSREFVASGDVVTERIGDTSGQFTMERRFGMVQGEWHLIYYREMGLY